MSLIDKIKEIFNRGPDSWEERLQKECILTSPTSLTEFSAKWRGDPRSFERRVAEFDYPHTRGTITQDLQHKSARYKLTLFFEGKDCDLEAGKFFRACEEQGVWEVNHPVHGTRMLVLLSVSEDVDPVESGGVVKFDTDWIEWFNPETLAPTSLNDIKDAVDKLNASALQQFVDNVSQKAAAATAAIAKVSNGIANVMDAATAPFFQTLDALDTLKTQIQRSIQDTITKTTIITESLAGQLQSLTQLPAFGVPSADEKIRALGDALVEFVDKSPQTALGAIEITDYDVSKNESATTELGALGVIGGASLAIVRSDKPKTRKEALTISQLLSDLHETCSQRLDTQQERFGEVDIDKQFVSQSTSWNDANALLEVSTRYLLTIMPNLKVERRFKLDRPRAPIEIVLAQYGTLGANDELLDEFIDINELKGDEILFLPANREVIIYA